MALSRRRKDELAREVISRVADIVEYRSEILDGTSLAHVSAEEIRAVLAQWMRRLPGTAWDTRLDG